MDVATNTMGAAVGALAAPRWRTAVLPSATSAMWLALVSLGGLIAIVAASAWALTPATARVPLIVRGVGRPDTRMRPERVLAAMVDGRAVRGRDTVRMFGPGSRAISMEVALQASRSRWLAEPSLRLVSESKPFLKLGIDDDELELGMRRNGEAVRFLSPSLRVPRPVRRIESAAVQQLDTVILRAVAARWWMSLAVQVGAAHRELQVRLHPLAGWSLLVSNPRSPSLGELFTALWTGVLVVPVAYWSAAAAARRPRLIGAAVSLSVAVVWAIGAAVGAPWPPWSAITALIVAVLAALRLRQAVRTVTARR
ncbi:MAG: hypothetical protein M3282_12370 [Gemmatimonadota bacterium]|nr:hypothetical protein [Gemmatimonadota bacterium]